MTAIMRLDGIATFARVVESGSFTAAARALDLPTSSVSRTVAQLEAALGVRLLQRTTRQLHLTDAGRVYYDVARAALADLEGVNARIASLGTEPHGLVRLTAPPDVGIMALPRILAEFTRAHPKVQVELSLSSRAVDLVAEGFDLAIRAGTLKDSSLVATKVGSTDLGLFASRRYLQERGTPQRLEELARHDCILFRAQRARAVWRLTGPHGEEKVEVRGQVAVDEMAFVAPAVAADLGIGLVPVFHCGVAQEVVRVLPEYAVRGGALSVVSPSARHKTAAVERLRAHLVTRLAEFPWAEAVEACMEHATREPRARKRGSKAR